MFKRLYFIQINFENEICIFIAGEIEKLKLIRT